MKRTFVWLVLVATLVTVNSGLAARKHRFVLRVPRTILPDSAVLARQKRQGDLRGYSLEDVLKFNVDAFGPGVAVRPFNPIAKHNGITMAKLNLEGIKAHQGAFDLPAMHQANYAHLGSRNPVAQALFWTNRVPDWANRSKTYMLRVTGIPFDLDSSDIRVRDGKPPTGLVFKPKTLWTTLTLTKVGFGEYAGLVVSKSGFFTVDASSFRLLCAIRLTRVGK